MQILPRLKIPLRIHQYASFQVKNLFISGEGTYPFSRSLSSGPPRPEPNLLDPPVRSPQHFGQIGFASQVEVVP